MVTLDTHARPLGRDVPPNADFGESMHGVTGKEPTFLPTGSMDESMHGDVKKQPCDKYGRPFTLPVDNEHRSKKLNLLNFSYPHMSSYYASTFSFFASFLATFAPAALMPVIRDDLDLDKYGTNNSAIASVCAAVASRIFLGALCDVFGPRKAYACLMMGCAIPTYCAALITDANSLIAVRFAIGLGLGAFVTNQYWSSIMFSTNVVGVANGLSAGVGNSGGGFTNLLMPTVLHALEKHHPTFRAWRWSFFFPGAMLTVSGLLIILFGEDCPDGSYREIAAKKPPVPFKTRLRVFFHALKSINMWIMTWEYAVSFGIELVADNQLTTYFNDYFGKDVHVAGQIAATFGMMAVLVRPLGGLVSDWVAKRFGMRARLWNLWLSIFLGGIFGMLMAKQEDDLTATIGLLIAYSFWTIYATGASYAITPFMSRRALGVISGFIGAGGNAGAGLWQAVYFFDARWTIPEGLYYLSMTQMAGSFLMFAMWFPHWGGMILPAKKSATIEKYYLSEYNEQEIKNGEATAALKFAEEASYHSRADERVASFLGNLLPGGRERSKNGGDNSPATPDSDSVRKP